MKRHSQCGDSPVPKQFHASDSEQSDIDFSILTRGSLDSSPSGPPCMSVLFSQETSSSPLPDFKWLPSSGTSSVDFPPALMNIIGSSDDEPANASPAKSNSIRLSSLPSDSLFKLISDYVHDVGGEVAARSLLQNAQLNKEVRLQIYRETHSTFKKSLKKSILSSRKEKKKRDYLLNLTPKRLCEELQLKVGVKAETYI